jgi:hypothetical protein
MTLWIAYKHMITFKTLLVERNINCPSCDYELHKGDIMYYDEYRDEKCCGYCKDEYREEVEREEGVCGELVK